MKMGVKEFRERFSEIASGDETVLVTKNGRIVGRYQPMDGDFSSIDWDGIEAKLEAFRANLRAATPDWDERLAQIGLDPDGEPIDPCA
jgi:hypothetical protein